MGMFWWGGGQFKGKEKLKHPVCAWPCVHLKTSCFSIFMPPVVKAVPLLYDFVLHIQKSYCWKVHLILLLLISQIYQSLWIFPPRKYQKRLFHSCLSWSYLLSQIIKKHQCYSQSVPNWLKTHCIPSNWCWSLLLSRDGLQENKMNKSRRLSPFFQTHAKVVCFYFHHQTCRKQKNSISLS